MKYLMILILAITTVSCGLLKNKRAENVEICGGIHMPEEDWISSEITRYDVQESEHLTDTVITVSGFVFDKGDLRDSMQIDTLPFAHIEYKTIYEESYTRGVVADINGSYTIKLKSGVYDFTVSFVGYNILQFNKVIINKNTNIILDFILGQGFGNDVFYMNKEDKQIYKVEEG